MLSNDLQKKVAIYQELERRGEIQNLPPEKQAAWAELKRRGVAGEQQAQPQQGVSMEPAAPAPAPAPTPDASAGGGIAGFGQQVYDTIKDVAAAGYKYGGMEAVVDAREWLRGAGEFMGEAAGDIAENPGDAGTLALSGFQRTSGSAVNMLGRRARLSLTDRRDELEAALPAELDRMMPGLTLDAVLQRFSAPDGRFDHQAAQQQMPAHIADAVKELIDTREAIAQGLHEEPNVLELAGQSAKDMADRRDLGVDPEFQKSPGGVGSQAIGGSAPMMAGPLGPLMGAGAMADEQHSDYLQSMKEQGLEPTQEGERDAMAYGAALMPLEWLPVSRIAARAKRLLGGANKQAAEKLEQELAKFGDRVRQYGLDVAQGMAEEGFTEFSQVVGKNVIAKDLMSYDEAREYLGDDVDEQTYAGMTVGGFMAAVMGLPGLARGGQSGQPVDPDAVPSMGEQMDALNDTETPPAPESAQSEEAPAPAPGGIQLSDGSTMRSVQDVMADRGVQPLSRPQQPEAAPRTTVARIIEENRRAKAERQQREQDMAPYTQLQQQLKAENEAAQKRKDVVDPDRDDLLSAIAKLGGLDPESLGGEIDVQTMRQMQRVGRPIVRGEGQGKTLDHMAEILAEDGFTAPDGSPLDPNSLTELIDNASRGERIFSRTSARDSLLDPDNEIAGRWFGGSRDRLMNALQKHIDGKPLSPNQQGAIDDLTNILRGGDESIYRERELEQGQQMDITQGQIPKWFGELVDLDPAGAESTMQAAALSSLVEQDLDAAEQAEHIEAMVDWGLNDFTDDAGQRAQGIEPGIANLAIQAAAAGATIDEINAAMDMAGDNPSAAIGALMGMAAREEVIDDREIAALDWEYERSEGAQPAGPERDSDAVAAADYEQDARLERAPAGGVELAGGERGSPEVGGGINAAPEGRGQADAEPQQAADRAEGVAPREVARERRSGDRRASSADALQKYLDGEDLTREEAILLATHSEVAPLPNKRAFKRVWREHQRRTRENPDYQMPLVVSIDADSLKWVNDNLSHDDGDFMLKTIGEALAESGADAFHLSGDEFALLVPSREAGDAAVAAAQDILSRGEYTTTGIDGREYTIKGFTLTHGIGDTIKTADAEMQSVKARKEEAGERAARGEKPAWINPADESGGQGSERESGQTDGGSAASSSGSESEGGPEGLTLEQTTETPADAGVSGSGVPQNDMFGTTAEQDAEQRLIDEKAKRDKKRDEQAARAELQSDGPLFDGSLQQQDLVDKQGVRAKVVNPDALEIALEKGDEYMVWPYEGGTGFKRAFRPITKANPNPSLFSPNYPPTYDDANAVERAFGLPLTPRPVSDTAGKPVVAKLVDGSQLDVDNPWPAGEEYYIGPVTENGRRQIMPVVNQNGQKTEWGGTGLMNMSQFHPADAVERAFGLDSDGNLTGDGVTAPTKDSADLPTNNLRNFLTHLDRIRQGKHPAYDRASDWLNNRDTAIAGFVRSNPAKAEQFANEIDGLNGAQIEAMGIDTPPARLKAIANQIRKQIDKRLDAAANEAATSPENDRAEPTEAQIEAGNYKKGHITVAGLDITIENPRGSKRRGTDPDGNAWEQELAHHYGYLKRTEGADGEHVDVFVGKTLDSDKVFIVDQTNADGTFDEHKVMLGFKSKAGARSGYKANYEKGWKVGQITEMSVDEFKDWLKTGDLKQPVAQSDTAPEHSSKHEDLEGLSPDEMKAMVDEFAAAKAVASETGITSIFDAPNKSEVVRLADKVKIYHKDHGWMTAEEAKAKVEEWKQNTDKQWRENRSENSRKVVLSFFDYTGAWSQPWEDAGYEVWRFDIQRDPELGDVNNFSVEFFADWFGDFDGKDVYAILAACPCTDFASSGARHFAAKDQDGRTIKSVRLVHQTLAAIEYFKPAVWALENPVGRIEKLGGLPPWRLSFDPNHLGETYTKKTLIWGRFNADLPIAPMDPVDGSKMHQKYGGKSMATKNARSKTPEGFSYAFFQANNAVDHPAMAISNKYDQLDPAAIKAAVDAGMPEIEISEVVDDFYYMDLDFDGANAALIEAAKEWPAVEKERKTQADDDHRRYVEAKKAMVTGQYGGAWDVFIDWYFGDKGRDMLSGQERYNYRFEADGEGADRLRGQLEIFATGTTELNGEEGAFLSFYDRLPDDIADGLGLVPADIGAALRSNGTTAAEKRKRKQIQKLRNQINHTRSNSRPWTVRDSAQRKLRAMHLHNTHYVRALGNGKFDINALPRVRLPEADVARNIGFMFDNSERGGGYIWGALPAEDLAVWTGGSRVRLTADMISGDGGGMAPPPVGSWVVRVGDPEAAWDRAAALQYEGVERLEYLGDEYPDLVPVEASPERIEQPTGIPALDNDMSQKSLEAAATKQLTGLLRRRLGAYKADALKAKAAPLFEGKKMPAARSRLIDALTDPAQLDPVAVAQHFGVEMADSIRQTLQADPAPEVAPDTDSEAFGANNKLVSRSEADEALALLRSKLGQHNTGIDPEMMAATTKLAVYYIEGGIRSFPQLVRKMVEALGTTDIIPYVRSAYEGARYYPGMDEEGMTPTGDVSAILAKAGQQADNDSKYRAIIEESDNAPSSRSDLESDRADAAPADELGQTGLQAEPDRSGRTDGSGAPVTDTQGRERQGDRRPADRAAPAGGEPGNLGLDFGDEQSGVAPGAARSAGSLGGRPARRDGAPPQSEPGRGAAKPAASSEVGGSAKREAQNAANRIPVRLNDPSNVAETLPYLLADQIDDVVKIERRLFGQDKAGVLVTNGTGTGKTYTGGGTIARAYRAGMTEQLIVVPSQAKADDWVEDMANLGMTVNKLDGIRDQGKPGINITTYANFSQNMELLKRDFQLVTYDESHRLNQNQDNGGDTAAQKMHFATANKKGATYLKAYARDPRYMTAYYNRIENEKAELAKQTAEYVDENGTQPTGRQRDILVNSAKAKAEDMFRTEISPFIDELIETAEALDEQLAGTGKVQFLSATPFGYHFNLDYADGFLFDFPSKDDDSYNAASGRDGFYMAAFGYRKRYNKLTIPETGVDVGLMERQFHEQLKKEGALIGRQLDVPFDYSRDFVHVNTELGKQIDKGIKLATGMYRYDDELLMEVLARAYEANDLDINEMPTDPDEARNDAILPKFDKLSNGARQHFNYAYIAQLREAVLAQELAPRIREHLKLGRKVVLFHDYRQPPGRHPFDFGGVNHGVKGDDAQVIAAYRELEDDIDTFHQLFPEMKALDLTGLKSVDQLIEEEFGKGARTFNGTVSDKDKIEAKRAFNDDKSGVDVIAVQRQSGKEGLSLHDVKGDVPRALIDLGLPIRPTDAIQTEGRIYRMGQQSDAVIEYPVLALQFEQRAFADKVSKRARTPENLAMGEKARDMEMAFKEGYVNAGDVAVSDQQGKGGKEMDRTIVALTDFDKAKSYYFANQKNTKRRDQREGQDYFATPEPLGFKMAQWLDAQPNDRLLEPSAGHGAIARFFPGNARNTFVEPSPELSAKLGLYASGEIKPTTFENHNIVNKYEGIAMNPPFGHGGSMAVEHLKKAAGHLANGGRVVAIIPTGPAADKKLDAFLESKDAKHLYQVARIKLPAVTFERAGTAVRSQIVVLEKHPKPDTAPEQMSTVDLTHIEDINEFFDRISDMELPPRRGAEAAPESDTEQAGAAAAPAAAPAGDTVQTSFGDMLLYTFQHSKTGEDILLVIPQKRLDGMFKGVADIAKAYGGWYNRYAGGQAKRGFAFKTEQQRREFLGAINAREVSEDAPRYSYAPSRSRWDPKTQKVVVVNKPGEFQRHRDYDAAKFDGDLDAAYRLTRDMLPTAAIEELKRRVIAAGSSGRAPIIVPVHAKEGLSTNRIPVMAAVNLSERTGWTVADDVVQLQEAGRSAGDGFYRLVNQPAFDGEIQPGRDYVLVDDTLTQGGTLASLKGFIESRGGRVVAALSMEGKQYSSRLAPTDDTLRALKERWPELEGWWNENFSYGIDRLTESEARYLARIRGVSSFEQVRDRLLAARSEGGNPPGPGAGPQGQPQSVAPEARPTAGLSASGLRKSIRAALGDSLAASVTVVQSTSDLPLADGKSSQIGADRVEGLYQGGKVYLVADNLPNADRAAWVAWHELWHRGARGTAGARLTEALQRAEANATVGRLADAIAADRGMSSDDRLVAVEEALAELNAADETGDYQGIEQRYGVSVPKGLRSGVRGHIARFMDLIRAILRKLGIGKQAVLDRDVFAIINGARRGYERAASNVQREAGEAGRVAEDRPRQTDLFDQAPAPVKDAFKGFDPAIEAFLDATGSITTQVEPLSGPTAAANFLRQYSDYAQEVALVVPLDENHMPLGIIRHTKGTVDGSSVYPEIIAGELLLAGAKSYWVAHNHPSGVPTPSGADGVITKRINEHLKPLGIPMMGHVILGSESITMLGQWGNQVGVAGAYGERTYDGQPVKVLERIIRRLKPDAEMMLPMDSSEMAVATIRQLGLENRSGALVLNNKYQIVRVALYDGDPTETRGNDGYASDQARDFLREVTRGNAAAVIVFSHNDRAAQNLHALVSHVVPNTLDAIRGGQSMVAEGIDLKGLDGFLSVAPRDPAQLQQTGAADRQGKFLKGILHQPIDRMFRLPFDALGMIDSHGRLKAGVKLTEGAKRTIANWRPHPEGRFGWMDNALEVARAGLIDRYGLSDEYKARWREAEAEERIRLTEGLDILRTLQDHKVGLKEARVLQAILTGEEIAEGDWKDLAEPIRRALDDLGQELVSLGLLSAEAYQRNRGTYLHRSYLKHEASFTPVSKWVNELMTKRRRKIVGNELKGRGIDAKVHMSDLRKASPDNWWGSRMEAGKADLALKDAQFILFEQLAPVGEGTGTLEGMEGGGPKKRRVIDRQYWPADLPVPAKFGSWENRGKWQVRSVKGSSVVLWRDYTKAERERMGEIVDARYNIAKTFEQLSHDIAIGRFFSDIAKNPEWFSAEDPEGEVIDAATAGRMSLFTGVDWVRVPTGKIPGTQTSKWGALAGGFVRAEIWRDLNELDRMQTTGVWRELLTQWKQNKTARSPVVHMNNVMSNMMFMDLADVRVTDLVRGIDAYMNQTADYQDAIRHGAFEGSFVTQEIRNRILKPILDEIMQEHTGGSVGIVETSSVLGRLANGLMRGIKKFDDKMLDVYQMEDELFRMATYMRRLELGDSPAEAASIAREQFLDYDIRAPWVNAARRTVLPFISYTYRAVPVITQSVVQRPWKLAKYFTMAQVWMAMAYSLAPGDEEEEQRTLRDEKRGYTWIGVPRMMRMPWRDENGNPVFMDIRRWIPAGDVFDTNQGTMGDLGIPAPLQFGGPMMMAFELALNKAAFTGDPIYDELTDTPSDMAGKIGDWAYKTWMPSAAYLPGSWYWDKAWTAAEGGRDYAGQPYSIPQALVSSVGIKIQPHDVEMAKFYVSLEFNAKRRELQGKLRQLARDHERNLIDDEYFEKRQAKLVEQMKGIAQDVQYIMTGEEPE